MTFVVTESCIKCKYTDCVDVCPVDCFYEGANMLVIHPDECIDCGVCEPECPVDAIKPDTEPGLALTLNNSLGAHVEIERIGPREIALRLVGHKGPPTAEAVSRIRDELRARGLKVGALSVA